MLTPVRRWFLSMSVGLSGLFLLWIGLDVIGLDRWASVVRTLVVLAGASVFVLYVGRLTVRAVASRRTWTVLLGVITVAAGLVSLAVWTFASTGTTGHWIRWSPTVASIGFIILVISTARIEKDTTEGSPS